MTVDEESSFFNTLWNALKSTYKYTPSIYLMFFILSNSIENEEVTFNLQETASKNQVRNFQDAIAKS